jgi:hypothetical protein
MACPAVYLRRQPERSVLYQAVRDHLPTFLSVAAEAEREVPKFVRREMESFLDCGILARGCVRVRCRGCGFDRLVAFSCKGRGLCPSCAGRRMAETAVHLVDEVFPRVPVRQWVLTLPQPLRYVVAFDTELLSAVSRLLWEAVFSHLAQVARRELGLPKAARVDGGAVVVPQRFGSALNLAPHLHVVAADGVWVQSAEGVAPVFHALPEPSRAEISAVAWRVCERTVALLRRRGQWLDGDGAEDPHALSSPLLSSLAQASLSGTLILGPHAGKRVLRLHGAAARDHDDHDNESPRNGYGCRVGPIGHPIGPLTRSEQGDFHHSALPPRWLTEMPPRSAL